MRCVAAAAVAVAGLAPPAAAFYCRNRSAADSKNVRLVRRLIHFCEQARGFVNPPPVCLLLRAVAARRVSIAIPGLRKCGASYDRLPRALWDWRLALINNQEGGQQGSGGGTARSGGGMARSGGRGNGTARRGNTKHPSLLRPHISHSDAPVLFKGMGTGDFWRSTPPYFPEHKGASRSRADERRWGRKSAAERAHRRGAQGRATGSRRRATDPQCDADLSTRSHSSTADKRLRWVSGSHTNTA
jgi:hypothetical protein